MMSNGNDQPMLRDWNGVLLRENEGTKCSVWVPKKLRRQCAVQGKRDHDCTRLPLYEQTRSKVLVVG